jgi:hypothetical protein
MSLIMRQAGGARGAPGGDQQSRPATSQMMREYAVQSRFQSGAMGDPFIHGWVIRGIAKVGGGLIKKAGGFIAGLGAGGLGADVIQGTRTDPIYPWSEGSVAEVPPPNGQENGRLDIPGEEWARRLPGGKTGQYTLEQVNYWKDRAGRGSGYRKHWNKSGYYREGPDGPIYIWPGMIQVRNRHRNPQNWRATSHALTRTRQARRRAERIIDETKSSKQVHSAKDRRAGR